MTPSGIGPETFRLVAQSINKLRRNYFIIAVRLAVRDQVSASTVFGGLSWNSAHESSAAKCWIEKSSQRCGATWGTQTDFLSAISALPGRLRWNLAQKVSMLCAAEQLAIIAKNPLNEKTRVTSVREYKFCPLIFYVFVQSGQNRHQTDVHNNLLQWRTQEFCSGGEGGFNKFSWGKRERGSGGR